MPVEPVNNNSLGVLQPIRPPQYQLTNPNPLNPAPFFQALQFNNQQQQMELQRLDQGLRQKDLDFRQSMLTFQQTKEILDYQNKAFENLYESNKQGTGSVQSPYGSTGLDTRFKLGQSLQAKLDAETAQFLDRNTKAYGAISAGTGEPNSKDLNKLLYEMVSGQSKLKQNMLQDPMYRELTGQTRQFGEFMKQLSKAREEDLYVDQRKVDEVFAAYQRLQNGEYDPTDTKTSKYTDIGILNKSIPGIQNIVFDAKSGITRLKTAATELYKPYEIAEQVEDPRAPGVVFEQKRQIRRSLEEGTAELVNFVKSDQDLTKMFSAATGLYDPEDPKYNDALVKWVKDATAPLAPLKGYENVITDAGPETIYDPADYLKGKASAAAGGAGSTDLLPGVTSKEGMAANAIYRGAQERNEEITGPYGTEKAILDIAETPPGDLEYEIIDEKTGAKNVYRVRRDKDGVALTKRVTTDGKTESVPDRVLIATISKRKAPAAVGGVQYPQGKVDTQLGAVVPTFQPGQLNTYRTRVAEAYARGEQNPIARLSENASQDSLAVDPQGARGRYQLHGVHQSNFLKSLGETNWNKAYEKLGAEEFAKKEDEYFNKNIRDKSLEYTAQAFKKAGFDESWLDWSYAKTEDGGGVWNSVNDYIASTANQSGDYQKIIDKAVKTFGDLGTYLAKDFLKSLYEARVDYITNLPDSIKGPYKDKWHEVAVNRPYQDYVVALDRINQLSGAPAQELEEVENPNQGEQATSEMPTASPQEAGSGLNAVQEAVSEVFSKNLGKEEIAKIYELTGKPVPGRRVVSFRSPATVFRPEEVSESELLRPLVEENFPEGAVNSYKKFGDYIFDIVDAMDGPVQLDDYIPALKNWYAVVENGKIAVGFEGKGTPMDKAAFYEFIRENGAAEAYRHSNPTETLAPKSDLLKSYGF